MDQAKFQRFVILLSPVPGTQRNEALIKDHVQFLRKLDEENKLVLCGPFTDYPGGMLIITAKDEDEAASVAEADPFVISGARTFEVRTWLLSCEENNHLGAG